MSANDTKSHGEREATSGSVGNDADSGGGSTARSSGSGDGDGGGGGGGGGGGALERLRAKQASRRKEKVRLSRKQDEIVAVQEDPEDPRLTAWLAGHARGEDDLLVRLRPLARQAEDARRTKAARVAAGIGNEDDNDDNDDDGGGGIRQARKRAAAARKDRRRSALDDLGVDPALERKQVRRGSVVGVELDYNVRPRLPQANRGTMLCPLEELDLTNCDLLEAVRGVGTGAGDVFTLMRGAVN